MSPSLKADLLVHSAQVCTIPDPGGPKHGEVLGKLGRIDHGALAIRDGRIVAVGEKRNHRRSLARHALWFGPSGLYAGQADTGGRWRPRSGDRFQPRHLLVRVDAICHRSSHPLSQTYPGTGAGSGDAQRGLCHRSGGADWEPGSRETRRPAHSEYSQFSASGLPLWNQPGTDGDQSGVCSTSIHLVL